MALNALDRHIALIGFMGAGKTTLAGQVAARLDRRKVDADRLIEGRVQLPLGTFFAKRGETEFRIAEAAIVRELAAGSDAVRDRPRRRCGEDAARSGTRSRHAR